MRATTDLARGLTPDRDLATRRTLGNGRRLVGALVAFGLVGSACGGLQTDGAAGSGDGLGETAAVVPTGTGSGGPILPVSGVGEIEGSLIIGVLAPDADNQVVLPLKVEGGELLIEGEEGAGEAVLDETVAFIEAEAAAADPEMVAEAGPAAPGPEPASGTAAVAEFVAASDEATVTADDGTSGTEGGHGGHDHGGSRDFSAVWNKLYAAAEKGNIPEQDKVKGIEALKKMVAAMSEGMEHEGVFDDKYVSYSELDKVGQWLDANQPEWDAWAADALLLKIGKVKVGPKYSVVDHVRAIAGMPYGYKVVKGRPASLRTKVGVRQAAHRLNRLFANETPHHFLAHVTDLLGTEVVAPGQQAMGGFERLDDTTIQARSPITGLRPVIEQAIADVRKNNPDKPLNELESRIARRLTQLNNWKQLKVETRQAIMILTGINFNKMAGSEREQTINHLLHSPLPFGDLQEALTPDTVIDFGFTHTLDKKRTRVQDLGDGKFRIFMVSNNNNGSHTGHSLGAFVVQADPGTTKEQAKQIGNKMVKNKNRNGRLYLDDAAKAILYGDTPLLDYNLDVEDRATIFGDKVL